MLTPPKAGLPFFTSKKVVEPELQIVLQKTTDLVWIFNQHSNVIFMNPTAEYYLGCSKCSSHFKRNGLCCVFSSTTTRSFLKAIQKVRETKQPLFNIVTPWNVFVSAELQKFTPPILDVAWKIFCISNVVVCCGTPVHHPLQGTVEEANDWEIKETIHNFGCPIMLMDACFNIIYSNREFKEFFGFPHCIKDRRIGLDFIRTDFHDSLKANLKLRLQYSMDASVSNQHECFVLNKQKEERFCLISSEWFRKEPGNRIDTFRMLVVFNDITPRKDAENLLTKREGQLREENIRLKQNIVQSDRVKEIVGCSQATYDLYKKIYQAAGTDVGVLIEGESGTGKELVARAIHDLSKKDSPMISVNCGAIPDTLAEALFFGHKKGAYTGAHADGVGYLQSANHGSLFLDEINSIPLNIQVKLLRVLETGIFSPVGSDLHRQSKFRLIAATNESLREKVDTGEIRADFYYRIKILTIHIPPLRDRKEDIPVLAYHFLNYFKDNHGSKGVLTSLTEIPEKILNRLKKYSFPGNIRELQNILFRYFVTGRLDIDEWVEQLKQQNSQQEIQDDDPFLLPDELNTPLRTLTHRLEKEYIHKLLVRERYNRTQVAKILQIGRKTLYSKMKKYGLE